MFVRHLLRALLVVLLAAGVTACGDKPSPSAGTADPGSGTESTAAAGSTAGADSAAGAGSTAAATSDAEPQPEGTGYDKPAPGGGGKNSVKTVGAPIGDAGQEENDDGSRCVTAAWLGGQDEANVGDGIAYRVTAVVVSGAERGGSCPGEQCDGFVFDSNSDQCQIGVARGEGGRVSLSGTVRCTTSQQKCDDFRSRLRPASIPVRPSELGGGESTESPEPTEPVETAEPVGTPEASPDEQPTG